MVLFSLTLGKAQAPSPSLPSLFRKERNSREG